MQHLLNPFKKLLFLLVITLSSYVAYPSLVEGATDKGNYSITPTTNKGKKWRIGYLEGGHFRDYQTLLKMLIKGLMQIGWIETAPLPNIEDPSDTKALWLWICKTQSKYLEFVEDAYYTSDFKEAVRPQTKAKLLQRLKEKKDIDLMLSYGTWAGQDLANNEHTIPTLVLSTSNPVQSKIIKSAEDSGFDHINALIDPTRYQRQIRLFYEMIGFKKLGVAYEHTLEGRTYAAMDEIETVAKEQGFEIVPCNAKMAGVTEQEAQNEIIACHKKFTTTADAVYITLHRGIVIKNMSTILAPLLEHKIPTFAQSGSQEVQHGVLFSISQAGGYSYSGIFSAKTLAKVLNGAKPRDLNQVFENPPKIAINLETAQIVGYDPPIDILGAADEIFQKIEK